MTGFGVQLDLLAQRLDSDQWGDLLVLVVMEILWLAGGLAKVITARKGTQGPRRKLPAKDKSDHRETWQERLVRKAQEFQRAAEAKTRELEQAATGTIQKPPHKRPVPPQPPAGKITIRHGTRGDSVIVYERPTPPVVDRDVETNRRKEAQRTVVLASQQIVKPRPPEPVIEPLPEKLSPLEPVTVPQSSPTQPMGFQPIDLIDYSDPDALKKAILHCEILGRPLGLREPAEETSPF